MNRDVYSEISEKIREKLLDSIESACNWSYRSGVEDCLNLIGEERRKNEQRVQEP